MSFHLDETQLKTLAAWQGHECRYAQNQGAAGGRFTYEFTPTSLGTVTKVKCACGSECDLTDYSW